MSVTLPHLNSMLVKPAALARCVAWLDLDRRQIDADELRVGKRRRHAE